MWQEYRRVEQREKRLGRRRVAERIFAAVQERGQVYSGDEMLREVKSGGGLRVSQPSGLQEG